MLLLFCFGGSQSLGDSIRLHPRIGRRIVSPNKQQHQNAPDIVIITGLSGSGMSSAVNAFEDLG